MNKLDADKRETEIQVIASLLVEEAIMEYRLAVDSAWKDYHAACEERDKLFRPVEEKWQAFQMPYFKAMQSKLIAAHVASSLALGEVRNDWQKCLSCGTFAARFQRFCTNDKCKHVFSYEEPSEVRIESK